MYFVHELIKEKESIMEKTLGYIIFGVGWPVLIIGSIWAMRKIAGLSGQSKTFLNVTLLTFYVWGYTCTM